MSALLALRSFTAMTHAHRTAGVAGLVFAVATIVGFSLQPALDFDATASTFAAQLAAGEAGLLASGVALGVAAVALHWFLSGLWHALDPAGEEAAGAALGPAGAAAGVLLAFGFLSVGALAAWSPQGGADAAALQVAGRLANAATNVALLPLAAAGISVAVMSRRGRAPAWVAILGAAAAALSVLAAGRASDELGFLALLLWLVWTTGLSVGLLRGARTPSGASSGREADATQQARR